MPTEAEIQIITELMKLNKTLEHLTKEHVQHFQEWRSHAVETAEWRKKNGN